MSKASASTPRTYAPGTVMPPRIVRIYHSLDEYQRGLNVALAAGYRVESTVELDESSGGGIMFWACLLLGLFTLVALFGIVFLIAAVITRPQKKHVYTVTYVR